MPRRRYEPTGPDLDTRNAVMGRSGGRCERCRAYVRSTSIMWIHHRDPRKMGGSRHVPWINALSNLVYICDDCHTRVESRRHEALLGGWLVLRSWAQIVTATTQFAGVSLFPVRDNRGDAWVLDDEGGKHPYTMHDFNPVVEQLLASYRIEEMR